MAVTRKGYNLSGFSTPLDQKAPVKPTTPVATKTTQPVATTPAKTWDAPTQAQKPVTTVPQTPQTVTKPVQPTTTPQTQATPKTTQQPKLDTYTQPATDGRTKVGVPLDQGMSKTPQQAGQLDYQTPDEARLQQIQQNLTQYSQTSPEMFKDRASFEANFNYGGRSDAQKQVLDNFYKSYNIKQGNPDTVYQTLMGGGQIDPNYQNTEGFKQGYARYQNIGALSSLDAKGLAQQIGSRIIVGSSDWQELSRINPQLAQEALLEKKKIDAERMVNGTAVDMTGIDQDRLQEVDVLTKSLVKQFENLQALNIDLAEQYRVNVLEDPVIQGSYEKIRTLSEKRNTIESQIDASLEEAYASAGGAPDSVIRARANMTSSAMLRQLSLVDADIQVEQAFMDSQIKMKQDYYSSIIDEYNQNLNLTQQKNEVLGQISGVVAGTLQSQREEKAAAEQANLEFERDMIKQQALQEYEMTKDENAYLREIQKADVAYAREIEKLGITANLDLQNDLTLAQQKAGLEGGGTVVGSQLVTQNPQSIVDYSVLKRGTEQLQCGQLTNDYVEKITGHTSGSPTWVGDSYQSKVDAIKAIGLSPIPQVGGLFAFNTKSGTGHIGIVQSVNQDGSIQVLEANRLGSASGEAPKIATYKNTSNMVFSKEPKPKLSKDDTKMVGTLKTEIKGDPIIKQYQELYNKESMLNGIISRMKSGNTTPQDKQQLISDFAKVLDPESVVRESEYELSAKYSQSRLAKYTNEMQNYLLSNGPLTDGASELLAYALQKRYDAYRQNAINAVDAKLVGAEYTLGYSLPSEALGLSWYNKTGDDEDTTTQQYNPLTTQQYNPLANPNSGISTAAQNLVNDLLNGK